MIGQEIGPGRSSTLQDFVKNAPQCVKYTDFIDKNYIILAKEKKNIFVGFGFVSHVYGLSEGVPIDIYTMLITAEKIRRQVLAEGAKVHVLIADHLAFTCEHDSCRNPNDVAKKRDKYYKKLSHILVNLKIAQHYVFHFSSAIIKEESFIGYKNGLETQMRKIENFRGLEEDTKSARLSPDGKHVISEDTWDILHPTGHSHYGPSNRYYFLEQTALIRYFYEKHGCGIKIGWTKAHQNRKITNSRSFDEPHFDRFYREIYFDHESKVSFIYPKSGFAVNRIDERAKTIPYTAPHDVEVKRVLLSKQGLLFSEINSDLIKSVAQNTAAVMELQPEVVPLQVDTEISIAAFYKNVTFLRLYGKSPMKHLAIKFNNQLQLTDDAKKDQAASPATCSNDAKL